METIKENEMDEVINDIRETLDSLEGSNTTDELRYWYGELREVVIELDKSIAEEER